MLENNVAIISCNSTHHPTGLFMPLYSNTIQNERYRAQLEASEPLKKQLWMHTIMQKIKNQAAILESIAIKHDYLIPLYKNVKSGDSDNAEATAAAYYCSHIFPDIPGFRKFRKGVSPNNYLNYGYSLLWATMARSIVGAGLLPTLGIHHANRYNVFCLADDLMETYRPIVDDVVIEIMKSHGLQEDIPKEIKTALLKIPVLDVIIEKEKSPNMVATHRTAVSIVKCFTGEALKPVYPELI